MSAIFSKAFPVLLDAEGGEGNSTTDYGGLTKYGISQKWNPDINVHELTEEGASAFYEKRYWEKYRLGEIIDQTIATQCLLLIINMDDHKALNIIQTAINNCGRTITSIPIDGAMGSITIAAINSLNRFWLSDRIRVEAIKFYLKRTDEDHSQVANLRSWIRRSLL